MEPARRFQDLVMWQKSHALILRTYQAHHNVSQA